MDEYPGTLLEFEDRFGTDALCRDYLCRLRWPDGYRCSRCGHDQAWRMSAGLFKCKSCGYRGSVTAGTIFQDTHVALRVWFRAIWWVMSQKNGASALGLQQALGIGSYRTAWAMLHKLRRAMVRPGRDLLSGRVEVDETFVGGEEEGARGRQTFRKALVVVAAEEDGPGIGRIRLQRVADATAASLIPFVIDSVVSGSVVHTDGWSGYLDLEAKGYGHERTPLRGKGTAAATELLPRIHLVASLLKRWLLGTHQGAVSNDYLDYYLDEFTFRFNRRTSRRRGMLVYRLLQSAVATGPSPYETMVGRAGTVLTDYNP